MTQIAPATLIAIQTYSAPAAARPAAPGTFEPLSTADLAPRRHGEPGDAPVRLSTEALTLLGGSDPQQDAPPQRAPAAPRAPAGAWRTEPPGSRLDITV
jgi:hypothetical protein